MSAAEPAGQARDYLLLISLGPVQEFIAAGRKTRDLFAGSHLLSEVSRTVARFLARQQGVDGNPVTVIFPGPASVDDTRVAVANKILARVNATPDGVRELAGLARGEAQSYLTGEWTKVRKNLSEAALDAIDANLAKAQIDSFLEWYAAWTPFDPRVWEGELSYAARRQRIERLLGGRKALRDFAPADGREGVPKSALDPSRESVLWPGKLDASSGTNDILRELRLKGAEQLDAVSFIKRLDRTRFVSVSRVALDPFFRLAVEKKHGPALQTLSNLAKTLDEHKTDLAETFATNGDLSHFAAFPYDCQLPYETPESVKWLLKRDKKPPIEPTDQDTAIEFVKVVDQLKKALDVTDPPAYFAVLRADGDRMGRALNEIKDPGHHQTFSDKLGEFAGQAKELVARHCGALVYSGGDDVLAFLPLDTALPCADELRRGFARIMNEALDAVEVHDDKKTDLVPTLSVGMAIGHYADHLQAMLERADRAEKAAKRFGRNALAVSFAAHSGGGDERTVVHGWGAGLESDLGPVATRWWPAVKAHLDDLFPDKGAYELDALRRECQELVERRPADAVRVRDVLDDEVERILGRKRVKQSKERVQKQTIEEMLARLRQADDPLKELECIVNELLIARRIAPVVALGGADVRKRWPKPVDDLASNEDDDAGEESVA